MQRAVNCVAIGADVALDPQQVDAVKQILADTGKRGVDLAIDCAGKETRAVRIPSASAFSRSRMRAVS